MNWKGTGSWSDREVYFEGQDSFAFSFLWWSSASYFHRLFFLNWTEDEKKSCVWGWVFEKRNSGIHWNNASASKKKLFSSHTSWECLSEERERERERERVQFKKNAHLSKEPNWEKINKKINMNPGVENLKCRHQVWGILVNQRVCSPAIG